MSTAYNERVSFIDRSEQDSVAQNIFILGSKIQLQKWGH